MVHARFLCLPFPEIPCPLPLHQCLLVPVRLAADSPVLGYRRQGHRRRKRAGHSLCHPLQSPEYLGNLLPFGIFPAAEPGPEKELLYVPFFGWAMAMLRPIAIDRENPKEALREVASKGDVLLKDGVWVLIFPEGTRVPYGTVGKFTRSGAALAVNAGLPVLPIAHNAGKFWPRDGWGKRPGIIEVMIGPPMFAEGSGPRATAELNDRAATWITEAQRSMGALVSPASVDTSKVL